MQRILPDWQTLSLEQQVAQLFVVRTTGHLFDHQIRYPQWEAPNSTLKQWIQELGVGGVILLGGSAAEVALRSQQLQDWAELPLFLAADIEEGVGQRFDGAIWMPPPMALGAIATQGQAPQNLNPQNPSFQNLSPQKLNPQNLELALNLAQQMGAATAQEAHAIGLNWLLAPVVDVNNNPLNPVINVRAFGDDPKIVSQLTAAFIQGAQAHPVLATAKHFPGHGDTATDSHLELPLIPHGLERLQAVELEPFRSAIAAGVSSIMTAHLLLPELDEKLPATLSPKVLTDLLRGELGYDGLVVTDALVMQAITQRYGSYEAPVLAFEAGADVLLMPVDPAGAIDALCEAVRIGRISETRLQASLERIWRAKMKINDAPESLGACHAWEGEPPPTLELEQLAQPEVIELSEQILRASQQVKPGKPLSNPGSEQSKTSHDNSGAGSTKNKLPLSGTNLIVVDNLLATPFLNSASPAIARPQTYTYQPRWIDNQYQGTLPTDAPTLLQLFIRGNPFRGSAGSTELAMSCLNELLEKGNLQGLILYGSPYAWEQFVTQLPDDVPAVFSYGQMATAQAIALGTLFEESQQSIGADRAAASEAFTD